MTLGDLPFRDIVLSGQVGLRLHQQRREGGDNRDVFVEQQLNGLVAHGTAVFDHIHAELRHAPDAGIKGRMRSDGQAISMRLVDDRAQLIVGELQQVVATHDLDQIGAALYLVTDRAPHFIGAAGFAAAPKRMAAGLYDRFAGD